MTQEAKAFFSYSRLDAEFALKLAKDLRNAGAGVWIDQLDISPGDHWDIAIQKAVGSSSSLLVILSPHSVESENVMDEVSYAIQEKKLVIPVVYQKCDIPLRLRRVQYVDAQTDYESGLRRILALLQAHQQSLTGSGPQPSRASTAQWDLAQARAAAEAREREKAAQLQAAQEQIARDNAPRAGQQWAQQSQQGSNAVSRNRLIGLVAGGVILLVALTVLILKWPHHPVRTASVPASDQGSSNADTTRRDLHQWLQEFLAASQGPSADRLRSYFDDPVSPYYSMSSARWSDIRQDKQNYFSRFPEIRYQLLLWRNIPQPDGSQQIECDVSYHEVRNDGVPTHGASHLLMNVRFNDGQWKITGIREGTP
jgi:TIR domain